MDIMQLAAAPCFIRVIFYSPQLRELIIPKEFVEENLNIFLCCTSVILQAPGGQGYEVNLKKKEGIIVLSEGWEDFAKHYDIDLGYFLVFHYLGSHFHVEITDTSNCEIDYAPYHCVQEAEDKEEIEEEDDDDGDNNESAASRGNVKMSLAYEKAEMFRCDYPSFIVPMRSSYISKNYRMLVPLRHGRRYFKYGTSKVKLVVEVANGGKTMWEVKLIRGSTIVFAAGWKNFAKDNHLSLGSVCKFELVKRKTKTYHVHIFTSQDEED